VPFAFCFAILRAISSIARFSVVDADEVAAALVDAEADSAEGVALRLLAKYNPVTVSVAAPVEPIVADVDSETP